MAEQTLDWLIEPIAATDFFDRYWDREPFYLERGQPDRYADLLDLEAVDRQITNDPRRLSVVDSAKGHGRETWELPDGGGAFVERLLEAFRDGGTLILDRLDRCVPELGRFCRELERALGFACHANVYVTPPGGQGFAPHYDTTNIFILQIEGAKHWQVGRERVSLPLIGDRPDEALCVMPEDPLAWTLEPGDLAFVPRGFVHQASAASSGSLHVTLGVEAPAWAGLVRLAADDATGDDAATLLPPGFLLSDDDTLAHVLMERVSSLRDLERARAAVAEFKAVQLRRLRPDHTGRLTELLRGGEPDPAQPVGARPGLVYSILGEPGQRALRCGLTVVQFADRAEEAIRFCLRSERFRPCDLPGPLTAAERIELVSALLRDGLLLRKP